jgi:hypothetical protein
MKRKNSILQNFSIQNNSIGDLTMEDSKFITIPETKGMTLVDLQYMENYNWEDEGEPYWKFKGGPSYFVQDLVKFLTESGEIYSNNHSKQYLLSALLMKKDYILEIPSYVDTQWERDEYIDLFVPKFWKDPEIEIILSK